MKIFVFIAAIYFATCPCSRAQSTHLATYSQPIEESLTPSSDAYIAIFRSLGPADAGPPGEHVYARATVELMRSIKGGEKPRLVECSLSVTVFPNELRESLPVVGVEYILVGNPSNGRFLISKLLDATAENIELVSKLLKVATISSNHNKHVEPPMQGIVTPLEHSPLKMESSKNIFAFPSNWTWLFFILAGVVLAVISIFAAKNRK